MFVWLQVESNDGVLHRLFWNTLDGSEIPNNHLKYIKTINKNPYHNDRFSISTGEFARFLFHQLRILLRRRNMEERSSTNIHPAIAPARISGKLQLRGIIHSPSLTNQRYE